MDYGANCTSNTDCLTSCCLYNACNFASYCQFKDHWRLYLSLYIVIGVIVGTVIVLLLYCIVKKLNENSRRRDAYYLAYMTQIQQQN
jgi:heme/copper-type cytochrome/quinol oxidase subunit 2